MPVITPSAPYDSLATVTQLTRTVLADYIQNLDPLNQGVVNVNGTALTWVSGNTFTYQMNGIPIVINGVPNVLVTVISPTSGVLLNSAGVMANAPYTLNVPTGDFFADTQAYVLPTINLAWRKLQKKLDYSSHPRMRNRVILTAIPAVTSQDPSAQQWISWTNFFDGANLLSPATTPPAPVLPQDFLAPMRWYERQSIGTSGTNTFRFVPMIIVTDGITPAAKTSRNGVWDWREDAVYFPGSILSMDLLAEYQAFLPDISAAADKFDSTPVPIMRSAEALAFYAAGYFVDPRGGSPLAQSFMMKGDEATDCLTNRQAKVLQRSNTRRRAVYVSTPQYRYR